MPLLTRDMLNRVSFIRRYKKQLIYGGIITVILAAATAGGFFIYQKKNPPAKSAAAVRALPKFWVLKYFHTDNENDPAVGGADGDPDGDLLTNKMEYLYGTNPLKEDTDGDGEIDGFEVAFGRNPKGPGDLVLTSQAKDAVKNYIQSDQRLADFTEKNITAQVAGMLQPEKAVVLDIPDDKELKTGSQNDMSALEKYYNDARGLTAATDIEGQDIMNRFPDDMSAEEINGYIEKLQAAEQVLKDTPAPSEIVNIHKLKIAEVRAGIKLFTLARDDYKPDSDNTQFWHDAFYQFAAGEAARELQLAAWQQVGLKLQDMGGL